MTTEKIGTLQYDMIVSQEELDKSIKVINEKLKLQDDNWKKALSNVGAGYAADMTKMETANKSVKRNIDDVATSIKALEKELKASLATRRSMSAEDRKADQPLLDKINIQKLQLSQEKKLYEQEIRLATEAANAKKKLATDTAKWEESLRKARVAALAAEPNTIQKVNADKKVIQTQLKEPNISDAQTKALTVALNQNDAARRRLIATQKEQLQTEKQLMVEEKLRLGINSQTVGSIGRLRAEIGLYTYQLSQIKKITPATTKEIERLNQAIAANKNRIQELQPTFGIWGKLKSAVLTYVTAYLSVQGALASGRAVYNQTKQLDQLNFSMKTVIKSATELAQTQKFLGEVAVNYGGDLLTLSERYIKFRAAAMQSNMSAEETQKIFNSVSKAAGTLGLKTDELSGVYLALEQMISKGKVTTEELRRQLGERLPGAFGIMANALGVTIPQLDKMLKKGQVLSQDALPKFAIALEKAYGIEALKKIDTLAAAQGRLSTETTLLIKSMGASDTFKGIINALASMVGFFKDNISAIALLAKAFVGLTLAIFAYRAGMSVSLIVQRTMVLLNKEQVVWLAKLTEAQYMNAAAARTASVGTTLWAKSWNALKLAVASNPLGAILVAITAIGVGIYALVGSTKKVSEALQSVDEESRSAANNVNYLYDAFKKSNKETDLHKTALNELNNVAIKYNSTLFTENDLLDKNNKKRDELLSKMDEEIRKKRYSAAVGDAEASLLKSTEPIQQMFFKSFEGVEGGYSKASLAYAEFIDIVKKGQGITSDELNKFSSLLGGQYIVTSQILLKTVDAYKKYLNDIAEADKFYKAKDGIGIKLTPFDEGDIAKAKAEFEILSKLKTDEQKKYEVENSTFLSKSLDEQLGKDAATYEKWLQQGTKTYEEFLRNRIAIYQKEGNQGAVNIYQAALTEITDKGIKTSPIQSLTENRNKALEELNNRYKQDQTDLVNFDAGVSATRIAIQEDSLEKEIRINELAYQNTLKSIEKEKQAREKLLLTISKDPSYSRADLKSITDEGASLEAAKIANAKKVKQDADIESTRKYAYQIAEIQRDINDQFLTGIEKERAAIKEKYDDWAYRARSNGKVLDEIEAARRKANEQLDKQYALDQLDFQREIAYKKNEIKYSGAGQQDRLDQANFQAYIASETERVKILLSMSGFDKQKEGIDLADKLAQERKLYSLTEEEKKRIRILDAAKQLSLTLVDILNLTQEESSALSGMVNIVSGMISEGLFSKNGMDLSGGKGLALGLEGATQILTTILNQSNANKKSQEAWNASIAEGARQLALLNIEAFAYKEANIFGVEDPYSKAIAGAKQYGAAMGELSKMATKLGDGLVQIGTKKVLSAANIISGMGGGAAIGAAIGSIVPLGITTLIGAGIGAVLGGISTAFAAKKVVPVFESLKKQYGEIYNKDTFEINPKILADYDKLDTATKKLVDNWKEIADKAKQAQDQMTATFSEMAGSLGDALSESLITAFANDNLYAAIDDFRNKVGDVIASITQQLLMTTFFQKYFDAAQQGFNESFGMIADAETGKLRMQTDAELARLDATGKKIADSSIIDDLDTLANGIVAGVDGYGKAAAEIDRLLKEKGYAGGLVGTQGTSASDMTKGIQGVTEDTARRLEGLINSIRETGVIHLGNTKKMVESNQAIQAYSAQSLAVLVNIEANTANQLKSFNSVLGTSGTLGGNALKVIMA